MGNRIGFQINSEQIKVVLAQNKSEHIQFINKYAKQFVSGQFCYLDFVVFQFQADLQTFLTEKYSKLVSELKNKEKQQKIVVPTNWETIKIYERNANLRFVLEKIFRGEIQLKHVQRVQRSVPTMSIFKESQAFFTFINNFSLTQINRLQKLASPQKSFINQFPSDFLCISLKNGCSYYLVREGSAQKVDGSILGEKTLLNILKLKIPNKSTKELLKNAFSGKLKNTELLVQDIYGKGVQKLGLPKDLVASSMGKLGKMSAQELSKLTDEDITRSMLTTFAINIGIQISLNMRKQGIDYALFLANELHCCQNFYRMVQAVLGTFAPGKKIYFNSYSPFISCIGTAFKDDL